MTVSAHQYTFGTAPGALPGVGHAARFMRDPLGFMASLPAHGDLVRVRLGSRPSFVACHPDVVHQVLMDPRTFDKGGPFFDKARLMVGDGLSTSRFQQHHWQRRLMQPAFRLDRMDAYAVALGGEARKLAESWRPGQTIEVRQAMHAMITRTLSHALFYVGAEGQAEFLRSLPISLEGLYQRMVVPFSWWFRLPTPGNRRFELAQRRLRRVTAGIIAENRRNPGDQTELISLLLNGEDGDTGEPLSDDQIHDQLITLLTGGTDTSTSTLAFTFHLLGRHPEIEERLHAEVDRTVTGGTAAPGDLPALDYTRRVLTETLRLYPSVWMLSRATTAATELGGHPVPADADVTYSPYLLHRNPELFPDPERYDPDRWLPEAATEVPKGAMLPFGAGKRKCIGDNLAMTEMTLALATIAARWRLRPAPGSVMKPKATMTLGPKRLPMVCEPRF